MKVTVNVAYVIGSGEDRKTFSPGDLVDTKELKVSASEGKRLIASGVLSPVAVSKQEDPAEAKAKAEAEAKAKAEAEAKAKAEGGQK